MDKQEYALVKMIASTLYKKYCPMGSTGGQTCKNSEFIHSREDFIHLGIIGLLKAKKDYDPARGGDFMAYSRQKISGAILDAVRKAPMLRVPAGKYAWVKQLKQAQKSLQDKGIDPNPGNLAKELGWPPEKILKTESL